MKKITVTVEVPDGDRCDNEDYCEFLIDFPYYYCSLFHEDIEVYSKCDQCRKACEVERE